MTKKIKKAVSSKITAYVLLFVIIAVQLLNITCVINDKKKGFHSDEIFSFGLANSFYQPFIMEDNVYTKVWDFENVNEWESADLLREYVTVQDNERFRYDSVWYNQGNDRHPPLHYAVLHTMCSFFPNQFMIGFGYAINFICFAVTQIFVYLIGEKLLRSRAGALAMCLLWGFSSGAVDMTIFIRMYSMLTMWVVIFMYLHTRLSLSQEIPGKRMIAALVCITMLGALTQHVFLMIAFVTAVAFCIRYLVKKNIRGFLVYGFSVLGGTLLSVLIFPASITHFLTEDNSGVGDLFFRQVNTVISYVLADVFSLSSTHFGYYFIYIITPIIAAVVLSLPLLFLFRKNERLRHWFSDKKKALASIPSRLKRFTPVKLVKWIGRCNIMLPVMLLCTAAVGVTVAYKISFFEMNYVNRYLFPVLPLLLIAAAVFIRFIFSRLKYCNIAVTAALCCLSVNVICNPWYHFLFDYRESIPEIREILKDSDCILAESVINDTWHISNWVPYMYDADRFFLTDYKDDINLKEDICKVQENKNVFVIMSRRPYVTKEKYEKQIEFFKNLPITEEMKKIGTHTIYNLKYDIYRIRSENK